MISNDMILIDQARRNGAPSRAQHARSLARGRVIEHRCETGEVVAIRAKRPDKTQYASRKGWQVYFPRR